MANLSSGSSSGGGAPGAPGADGDFIYVAYASASNGTGFTNTFNSSLEYIAIKRSATEIASPVVGDFTGLWTKYKGTDGAAGAAGSNGAAGASSYTYIAYASAADGTGFTMTFSAALSFIAIKTTTSAIASPVAGDFTGLFVQYLGGDAVLSDNSVTTAKILDANVTTAKIALNAVGNQRMAQMPANTLKGNATAALANSADLTLSGGLSMNGTSVIKSKTGFAFNYLFDTDVGAGDPTATYFKFDSATTPTTMTISASSLGGRNIDPYLDLVNRGAFCFMSNNVTSTAWGIFQATGISTDVGDYFTVSGSLLTGVGSLPADNEECVIYYNPVSSAADVDAINKTNLYLRRNALNQIINEAGVVISGTPVVANQAALPSVTDYDGFTYRVDNQGLYGIDYQANAVWSPSQGTFLHDIWTNPAATPIAYIWPANTWNGAYTLSSAAAGAETLITGAGAEAHGLTSAVAVGKYIYVTAGTNMVGAHRITAVAVDTTGTTIQIAKTYNAANTITSVAIATAGGLTTAIIPIRTITIPVLRANSAIEIYLNILSDTAVGAVGRHTYIKLGSDTLYDQNYSSVTIDALPSRFIIGNTGSVSLQRAVSTENSTGFVSSGTGAPLTGTTNTGVESTLVIQCGLDTANVPVEYVHGQVYIRG